MIVHADNALQAWVQGVVGEGEVILGPPRLLDGKQGISLYLLALSTPPSAWMNRRPAPRVALRYLITTWAADDEGEAHRLLGLLVQAALEKSEYELDLGELPAETWSAFKIAPRPALVLRVPLSEERHEPPPKLVQGPLIVRGAPMRSLRGLVLGPGDHPLFGASVAFPALQLRTQTDVHGRFAFAAIPGELGEMQLVVNVKGYVQQVIVQAASLEREPLTIHFDRFKEDRE